MKKLTLLALFFPILLAAFEFIGRPLSISKSVEKIKSQNFKPKLKEVDFKLIDTLFLDKNLLDKAFPISDSFQNRAKFWLYVYGSIPSSSVIIHSKSDLTIVYKELDFSKLWNSKYSALDISLAQSDMAQDYTTQLKKDILSLCLSKNIQKDAKKIHLSLATNSAKTCSQYEEIANDLRIQTGKNDISYVSLHRYYELKPFLDDLHELFDVPQEVNAIAFLESNFNPRAHSHAGAYGVWQFMPNTANFFFPKISSSLDYRVNPYTATLGAFHLLKQNYRILDSWELAIPAYNFGVNQILKAKKALKKDNLSLDYLFQHYQDPILGFASKNYYGNFLAASVLLAKFDKFEMPTYKPKKNTIDFYITKCSLVPRDFFRNFKNKNEIEKLNTHILATNKRFPKGLLLVSNQNLTASKYYKLTNNDLKRNYPKNFSKFVKNSSCR